MVGGRVVYEDFDESEQELFEYEQEILDAVLRMFPGGGDTIEKLDKYIAYEADRSSSSSDGKWHRETLMELERIRVKLTGEIARPRVDVDWETVRKIMARED